MNDVSLHIPIIGNNITRNMRKNNDNNGHLLDYEEKIRSSVTGR